MNTSEILPYFQNTFWLLLPILAFNVIFVKRLPRAYQTDVFWKNIPSWIGVPENLFRLLVFCLPLIMRFGSTMASERLGLWLYLGGTLIYFASWWAQISLPESKWSTSAAGFMGPSYTPILWLAGIGLIGDSLTMPGVPYKPWVYPCVAVIFLAFHNLHAWRVHARHCV
jgi:hypothetical protein